MADHKAEHEAKTAEPHAEPKEEVPDTPDTIVTRIEANVARLHTATPSGIEAIQAEMTTDLEKLRSTAPPPASRASKSKADDDDEEEEKASRGRRK